MVLQLILDNLLQHQHDLLGIAEKSEEFPVDDELQQLLSTLRERIIELISRVRQGNDLIEVRII